MSSGQREDPGGARRPRSADVAQRAEATRRALLGAARRLFVEKGYFGTSTEEIVAEARVGTRGALYHHFADKQALFQAVLEQVEEDLLAAADHSGPTDALGRLRAGLLGFLDASLTPEVQRILLVDGPAVLGYEQWRAVEQRFGLGAIRDLLALAIEEGTLPPQPPGVMAQLLLAAVDEAALFIAHADDQGAARDEAVIAVDRLLNGLTDSSPARPADTATTPDRLS